MARAANMSYKDYAQILQAIQARMSSDVQPIRVDDFCKEIGSVIGRTVTTHQIEHVLHDNSIRWRDVFQPRSNAESGKHGGKQLAELQAAIVRIAVRINRVETAIDVATEQVRLLQTHTVEILRRLPPKTTINPTQTMFSEEQSIE
jgi:hypothetical protein